MIVPRLIKGVGEYFFVSTKPYRYCRYCAELFPVKDSIEKTHQFHELCYNCVRYKK